jgi:hypothetical protein
MSTNYNYDFVKIVTDEDGNTTGAGYCTEYSNGKLKSYYYSIDNEGNISYATDAPKLKTVEPEKKTDVNLETLKDHYVKYDEKFNSLVKLYNDRKALYESDYLKPANKEAQSELLSAIEIVANLRKEIKDLLDKYKV